ncbi:hypothetical protein [Nostoc sp.]|uniref:hypothetical protein n=1 Tax=Nostoc sp. TaxID=1180 RepID=UPI002FF55115
MADYAGSILPLQIYQAIRNRGYTNEVRLRGLKEFETHGGGFCLYSQASALGGSADLKQLAGEFHSPGQVCFYKSEMLFQIVRDIFLSSSFST